jgi:hypothetical protein
VGFGVLPLTAADNFRCLATAITQQKKQCWSIGGGRFQIEAAVEKEERERERERERGKGGKEGRKES